MTDELKQWEYDKGYTKGYSDGRASLIEELEKIKAEIEQIIDEEQKYDKKWAKGLQYSLKIIDNHISELKGE